MTRRMTAAAPEQIAAGTIELSERRRDPRQPNADGIPLCVDLDGTLLKSDSLWECLLDAIRLYPGKLIVILAALVRGRAAVKRKLAECGPFDAATLPYREELLEDLRLERAAGRTLVLCTGSDSAFAAAVAAHLGIFDRVLASDGQRNLKGRAKRQCLEKEFGAGGFDYVGDSAADLAVWRGARKAWVVAGGRRLRQARRGGAEIERIYTPRGAAPAILWKALRPHQWAKNLLVFLPLVFAHHWTDGLRWVHAALAFAAFDLAASAGYLINDLLDRRGDRGHYRKKLRPFASGDLPLAWGAAAPLLLGAALGLCAWLPRGCAPIIALYFAASLAYSGALKSYATMDVLVLACLYTVRLEMGGVAAHSPVSVWLLSFSVFIFLALALSKRVSELRMWQRSQKEIAPGRGYRVSDLPVLEAMGVGAGYLSAMVLLLYLQSADVIRLYRHAGYLWVVLPVLLCWMSRLWLLAHRGELPEDPLLFAFRDRASVALGVCVGIAMFLAV